MNVSVQPVSRTNPDNAQDKPRQSVDIDQAANIKGMKVETLRKRLQRGQEDGYKGNDGRWKVYVSDVQDTSRTEQDGSRKIQDGTGQALKSLVEEVKARLGDKNEVISYLQAQIAEKDRQLEKKDELVAQLISKLPDADSSELETLKEENSRLDLENKKNAVLLKRAYKILRDDLESGKR